MTWNDTAKVLWVATNSADDNVYALTPDDGWARVAVIGHPEGGGYTAAGLSMDDEGNLWMVSWESSMAYLVYSGIPHAGGLDWLEVGPVEGTVPAGESVTIDVTVDARDLDPGDYGAEVIIDTDSGREPGVPTVAVTARVIEPDTAPELTVTEPVEGTHTNDDTITVAGTAVDPAGGSVTVTINGEAADVDADGSFEHRILLPEDEGPFEITVTAANEDGDTAQVKRTVIVDRTAPAITELVPGEDVELEWGDELMISFTSEPGLEASYQVLVAGTGEEGLPGVAMVEAEPGLYTGTYTAPHGAVFTGAEIEVYAMDKAGNIARAAAPGRVSVVPDGAGEPDPVDPPVVVIDEPAEGFLTNRDAVRVSGTATDVQEGQEIESVTVNGRAVDVAGDGTFTTRIILWEGDNVIAVTAANTAGKTATEYVTVKADWTAPDLMDLEPAFDITLAWGETYTFRFELEEGLTAAYQIVAGGSHGTWVTRDIPIKGTPMTYVGGGVYEATYTAPAGVLLENAIIQFNAADEAGNVIMTTAPGELTVVETK